MKTFAVFLAMAIAVTGLTMAQPPSPDKAPDKKIKGQLPPGWKKKGLLPDTPKKPDAKTDDKK